MIVADLIKRIPASLDYAMMNEPIKAVDIHHTQTNTPVPYVASITFPNGRLERTEHLHAQGLKRSAYVLTCNNSVLAVFEVAPTAV